MDNPLGSPPPAALDGTTAYITASEGLLAVDAITGRSLAIVRTTQPTVGGTTGTGVSLFRAPIVADVGGRTMVLAAFVVTVSGQGTTPAHNDLEVLAVDPATNQKAWTAEIDLSLVLAGGTDDGDDVLTPQVLGAQGNLVIVAVTGGSDGVVLGIDARSHQPVWKQANVVSAVMDGTSVVGVVAGDAAGVRQQTKGFAAADGHLLWQQPDAYASLLSAAGPRLVAVGGRDYSSGRNFFRLLDASSGTVVQPVDGASPDLACAYDGRSTTVCSGVITNRVFAVDATSGAFLWQLPDSAANRVAPTVTAVWHGAVYGYTDNGPLVLDARTGADRDDSPGAAPNVVDGFVGIAPPQVINGPMIAYPAAG